MSKHSIEFIAAGGNRHPSAADWDPKSGILAFGSDSNTALWRPLDPTSRGVYTLLTGHQQPVNAVKFYRDAKSDFLLLLSGSEDKSIRVWKTDDHSLTGFSLSKTIQARDKSVNSFAALPELSLFAVGYASSEVDIFRIDVQTLENNVDVTKTQSLRLNPSYFPLCIALACLPSQRIPLLAVAGSRHIIQIFVASNSEFKLVATLSGHENWIRSLDFVQEDDNMESDLLLASASQDKYIRLWRVHAGQDLPPARSGASDPALGSLGKSLSNKAHRYLVGDVNYSVTFEALLIGHEDWIFTSRWFKSGTSLKLLTSSADNSLAIWEADSMSGVWICNVRLGGISAQKGATTATGSTGGFWIGLWSPKGDAIVCLGRTGAWRLWKQDEEGAWEQHLAVTGHTKSIRDICWARDGSYLLSTSSDQTTRLFAEWKRSEKISWHEFSRPQIHGYDLNCIDVINDSRLITGADEKLLRVFDKPRVVAEFLSNLSGLIIKHAMELPDTASIPVLGLSNKVIDERDGEDQNDSLPAPVFDTLALTKPPLEDDLARHLLWPEVEKLYGHGYEISAVAASHDGSLVATACKASSIDHALIRLFETESWREIKPPLSFHSLTVTSLSFSADDRHLLTVSRDRQCAVFERDGQNSHTYKLVASHPKAHSRMLLDASWAPSGHEKYFATAGRDKAVRFWKLNGATIETVRAISEEYPVTAVAFSSYVEDSKTFCAYGLENGAVRVCTFAMDDLTPLFPPQIISTDLVPSRAVSAIAWRPRAEADLTNGSSNGTQTFSKRHILAVASDDSSLRLFNVVPN